MTPHDETLVGQAQAGDPSAFEELVRRTSRLVFARLYLDVGDVHRAEDLVQETWLQAVRKIGDLKDPKSFRAWLLTIATNLARDAGRKIQREPVILSMKELPAPEKATDDARQEALSLLRSLPAEYQAPLALRYLAGADHASIETQLGLTNGSLRGLLHRGLKMLRERFAGD